MRQLIPLTMKDISNRSLICWVSVVSTHAFFHLHRAIRATTKTINNGHETCNERNHKHNSAYAFGVWRKVKPKCQRYRKSDSRSLHAVQIWTCIPLRREFSDFLVPFGAPFFFSLYHFLEHNRYSTTETAPSQYYEEKNL